MNVEQKARELLAEEYERQGLHLCAEWARNGGVSDDISAPLRAIARALEQQGGSEVVRDMTNWPAGVLYIAQSVTPDWSCLQLSSGQAFAFNRGTGSVYELPHPECPFEIHRNLVQPAPTNQKAKAVREDANGDDPFPSDYRRCMTCGFVVDVSLGSCKPGMDAPPITKRPTEAIATTPPAKVPEGMVRVEVAVVSDLMDALHSFAATAEDDECYTVSSELMSRLAMLGAVYRAKREGWYYLTDFGRMLLAAAQQPGEADNG